MRAAVYCRVSSEDQKERQTINNQREFAERFCEMNRIEIHGFYLDDAVSGTIPVERRPEGARLLQDARERRFDTVLVYKLDRLGRNPRLTLNAVSDLESAGVQIRSMTEPSSFCLRYSSNSLVHRYRSTRRRKSVSSSCRPRRGRCPPCRRGTRPARP